METFESLLALTARLAASWDGEAPAVSLEVPLAAAAASVRTASAADDAGQTGPAGHGAASAGFAFGGADWLTEAVQAYRAAPRTGTAQQTLQKTLAALRAQPAAERTPVRQASAVQAVQMPSMADISRFFERDARRYG